MMYLLINERPRRGNVGIANRGAFDARTGSANLI